MPNWLGLLTDEDWDEFGRELYEVNRTFSESYQEMVKTHRPLDREKLRSAFEEHLAVVRAWKVSATLAATQEWTEQVAKEQWPGRLVTDESASARAIRRQVLGA